MMHTWTFSLLILLHKASKHLCRYTGFIMKSWIFCCLSGELSFMYHCTHTSSSRTLCRICKGVSLATGTSFWRYESWKADCIIWNNTSKYEVHWHNSLSCTTSHKNAHQINMYFSLGKDLTSWLKTCSGAEVVSEMLMMSWIHGNYIKWGHQRTEIK